MADWLDELNEFREKSYQESLKKRGQDLNDLYQKYSIWDDGTELVLHDLEKYSFTRNTETKLLGTLTTFAISDEVKSNYQKMEKKILAETEKQSVKSDCQEMGKKNIAEAEKQSARRHHQAEKAKIKNKNKKRPVNVENYPRQSTLNRNPGRSKCYKRTISVKTNKSISVCNLQQPKSILNSDSSNEVSQTPSRTEGDSKFTICDLTQDFQEEENTNNFVVKFNNVHDSTINTKNSSIFPGSGKPKSVKKIKPILLSTEKPVSNDNRAASSNKNLISNSLPIAKKALSQYQIRKGLTKRQTDFRELSNQENIDIHNSRASPFQMRFKNDKSKSPNKRKADDKNEVSNVYKDFDQPSSDKDFRKRTKQSVKRKKSMELNTKTCTRGVQGCSKKKSLKPKASSKIKAFCCSVKTTLPSAVANFQDLSPQQSIKEFSKNDTISVKSVALPAIQSNYKDNMINNCKNLDKHLLDKKKIDPVSKDKCYLSEKDFPRRSVKKHDVNVVLTSNPRTRSKSLPSYKSASLSDNLIKKSSKTISKTPLDLKGVRKSLRLKNKISSKELAGRKCALPSSISTKNIKTSPVLKGSNNKNQLHEFYNDSSIKTKHSVTFSKGINEKRKRSLPLKFKEFVSTLNSKQNKKSLPIRHQKILISKKILKRKDVLITKRKQKIPGEMKNLNHLQKKDSLILCTSKNNTFLSPVVQFINQQTDSLIKCVEENLVSEKSNIQVDSIDKVCNMNKNLEHSTTSSSYQKQSTQKIKSKALNPEKSVLLKNITPITKPGKRNFVDESKIISDVQTDSNHEISNTSKDLNSPCLDNELEARFSEIKCTIADYTNGYQTRSMRKKMSDKLDFKRNVSIDKAILISEPKKVSNSLSHNEYVSNLNSQSCYEISQTSPKRHGTPNCNICDLTLDFDEPYTEDTFIKEPGTKIIDSAISIKGSHTFPKNHDKQKFIQKIEAIPLNFVECSSNSQIELSESKITSNLKPCYEMALSKKCLIEKSINEATQKQYGSKEERTSGQKYIINEDTSKVHFKNSTLSTPVAINFDDWQNCSLIRELNNDISHKKRISRPKAIYSKSSLEYSYVQQIKYSRKKSSVVPMDDIMNVECEG